MNNLMTGACKLALLWLGAGAILICAGCAGDSTALQRSYEQAYTKGAATAPVTVSGSAGAYTVSSTDPANGIVGATLVFGSGEVEHPALSAGGGNVVAISDAPISYLKVETRNGDYWY